MKYLRFFLPLAITSSMMSGSHVLVTAVLSRTADPAVALAAYALALGLAAAFEGPVGQSRQLTLALGSSTGGFRRAAQATWTLAVALLAVQSVIAYTPAGQALLTGALGVRADLLSSTTLAYRVFMWMGVASAIRFTHQGYLVRHRRTGVVAGGIGLRVALTICLGLFLRMIPGLPGAVVGAIMILSGVLCEGVVGYLAARPLLAGGVTVPDANPVPTYGQALLFYLPLAGSQAVASINQPAINAAVALSAAGTLTLAALSATQSVAGLVLSPMNSMHQLALVFGAAEQERRGALRFAAAIIAVATGLLALLAFTPLGTWFLQTLLGFGSELVGPVQKALRLWTLAAPVVGAADYCAGLLLARRNSRAPALARVARVSATVGLTWWLVPGAASVSEAVVQALLAHLAAYGIEMAINLAAAGLGARNRPAANLGVGGRAE